MPVAGQRDPEHIRSVLSAWLTEQVGEAVEITDLEVPQGSGFSNETFLLDATWNGAGPEPVRLVLRSQPQVYAVFPEIDIINQQYRTMDLLGRHTDLPVPRVRWAEENSDILGQPFFVMDRLDGLVPADAPPYTVEGFVMDMAPEQRRQLHRNGLDALVSVSEVDWRSIGFDHLDIRRHGTLGPEQRRNYFATYHAWAYDGRPHPVADPAWEWLRANWPDDGEHIELCWGDARPGNLMFDGTDVIGIFDWEMVSLGNSVSDLGWWLFVQRYHTDGTGVPLPEGFLTPPEAVSQWEQRKGRPAEHLDFYERLAGFQFTLVLIRIAGAFDAMDPDSPPSGMAVHNPVAELTADLFGIDRPAP